MEQIINNLVQKLISKNAEDKLNKDLQTMSNSMRNNKLIGHFLSDKVYPVVRTFKQTPNQENEWITRSLSEVFNPDLEVMQGLKAYWLPIYIQKELEAFIQKVDSLANQVAELQNF